MNRFDKFLGFQREAKLEYGAGEYKVIVQGDFVRCAVTGQPIPLDELRYWSVALQEPYVSAEASLQRYREVREADTAKRRKA